VTVGDRKRIADHTGQTDFWELRAPADASYLDQDDDPNWLKWTLQPDGTRAVLRRRPSGDCHFLTPAGCRLPMEVRPVVCRLYPYGYTEQGLTGIEDDYCPPEVIPPDSTILKVLDMRHQDAVRWHRILYTELRTGKPHDEDRPDL
jgi:Fe-S-cluster containining protein